MGFNKPPKMTFLVHGEPESSAALKTKIEKYLNWNVVIPDFDQSFELQL